MTTSQKAALSLLIAVILFGAFLFLVFNGLSDLLETRFNNSSKIILLAALFLTTFLIIFLLFNLRQDPLVVIQNRLKQLQISLIEQFYERKGDADWARWVRELEHRREEIRALLKRGVRTDSVKIAEMDILIDKSWDELLAMLGSRRNLSTDGSVGAALDEEKIATVLQKLLEARTSAPLQSSVVAGAGKIGLLKKAEAVANEAGKTELADEIEVLEELDETRATDDELFSGELEIVSPFSTMVFDFSPAGDAAAVKEDPSNENSGKNEDGELDINAVGINTVSINAETDATEGLPLITTPFSSVPGSAEIETLEILSAGEEYTDDDVILEREGVHYINEDVLAPSSKFTTTLNREFKELVDEVTK